MQGLFTMISAWWHDGLPQPLAGINGAQLLIPTAWPLLSTGRSVSLDVVVSAGYFFLMQFSGCLRHVPPAGLPPVGWEASLKPGLHPGGIARVVRCSSAAFLPT